MFTIGLKFETVSMAWKSTLICLTYSEVLFQHYLRRSRKIFGRLFLNFRNFLFSEGRVELIPFGQRVWKSINSKKGPEYFRSELSQATHKVHLRLELILTTLSLYLNTAAWMGYYKDAITLLALPRSNPSVHTFRFWAPISANLIASGKQE